MARSSAFENLKNVVLSLSTSQKRDFRKGIKFWGEKTQYDALYETINAELGKSPEFTFDQFLKLPTKRHGVAQKDFPGVAAYLCEKLIESARKSSPTGRLRRELHDTFENIYFLYGAELFGQCRAELEKAKCLAQQLDSSIFKIEVNFWERKLLFSSSEALSATSVEALRESENRLVEEISKNNFLLDLLTLGHAEKHLPKPSVTTIEKMAEFESAFLSGQFADGYLLISALKVIYMAISFPRLLGSDAQTFAGFGFTQAEILRNQETLIGLILNTPRYLAEDPTRNWSTLANYFSICFRLGRLDLIEEIEHQLPKDPETIAFLRYWAYFNLLKLIKQNRFSEAAAFVQKNSLLKRLHYQRSRLPHSRFCVLAYLSSVVLFVAGETAAAADFLDLIRRQRTAASPRDTLVLAVMLHLVVLFEEQRFEDSPDFLESEMRKARRFLAEIEEQDAFNRRFLLDFEKMAQEADAKKRAAFAAEVVKKLSALLDLKKDAEPYRILVAWFKAKSLGLHIRDVIKEFVE